MNGKFFNLVARKSFGHEFLEVIAKAISSGSENAVGKQISRSITKNMHSEGQYWTAPRLERIGVKTFPIRHRSTLVT
jgi:hypothetical protein